VAAKNHPTEHMRALQWLGKKHVGVKEMPKPCVTDKVSRSAEQMHSAPLRRRQRQHSAQQHTPGHCCAACTTAVPGRHILLSVMPTLYTSQQNAARSLPLRPPS
jgi:hypothetical protein